MKRGDYKIDILNLKNGEHDYEFQMMDTFFSFFENSLIEKGNLKADVLLRKSERLIEAKLKITGTVELECDRSLRLFDHGISIDQSHLFKYSENELDDSEDITYIEPNTESIDIGQLIYEYLSISIPMKKIHPDLLQEVEDEEEGFFFQTDKEKEEEQKEDKTDPRWDALKKLNR